MLGWIIALSVFGLIFCLLASSVKIVFSISKSVVLKVSLLGLILFEYDSEKPVEKPKTEAKTAKKEPAKENKLVSLLKEYKNGKTTKEFTVELLSLLKALCIRFAALLKRIRFKKLKLYLAVATDDAAKTAILYGNVCSLVYTLTGLLKSAYNFNPRDISVVSDFTSDEIRIELDSVIKIRIWFILQFVVSTAISVIKIKLGEVKNGRA